MYNFLESPRRYMPGTAMSFAGLRDQEDRINLIAYMHEQGSSDMPFPEPLAVPAEEGDMAEGEAAADAEIVETLNEAEASIEEMDDVDIEVDAPA